MKEENYTVSSFLVSSAPIWRGVLLQILLPLLDFEVQ